MAEDKKDKKDKQNWVPRELLDACSEHVLGVGKYNQQLQATINGLGADRNAEFQLRLRLEKAVQERDAEIVRLNNEIARIMDRVEGMMM